MLLIYTITFLIAAMLYYLKINFIASGLMIALAIFLYYCEYKKRKKIINICGLFALGFIGGFGVSLLKLSKLSADYNIITIIVVYVAYFSLYLGAYFVEHNKKVEFNDRNENIENKVKISNEIDGKSYLKKGDKLIIVLIIITAISFLIEAYILKFIPLFTYDTPHAYSTFHVFMIHYITTFYIFIPSFALANIKSYDGSKKFFIISSIYMILMSLLLVSRAQLIQSLVLMIFVHLIYQGKNILLNKKYYIYVGISLCVFLILYIFITYNRAHDVSYLNGIFEMKNPRIPIFISQPYMYVAHNFENLNYLINNLTHFSFGRRMLAPLFTLTLVKKYFPIVLDSPTYIIKEELTTKTILYDAYYDFGIVGVIVFMFVIGAIGVYIENKIYDSSYNYKRYMIVLYALYCFYMFFSFFQTFFSLTDTWVYITFIIIITLIVNRDIIVKTSKK